MNEKSSALLLLLIVVMGLGGFIIYDAKTNNRLGFGESETKDNWQWEDNWNTPIDPPAQPKIQPEQPKEQPKQPQEQIEVGTYAEAIKKSAETKMSVLVFFEADWCSWCKKLKSETLTDPKVKEAMKKYIVVHVNTDQDRAPAKKFGVKYLPSYAVTNAKEETLKADGGFKTPDQFLQWLGGSEEQPQKPQVEPSTPPQENQPPKRRVFPRRPQQCSDLNNE